MADPIGHARDNSIDSVISEGSSTTSRNGTPRRAHPALFPKVAPTADNQGTIRVNRLTSPPSRSNTGGIATAFDSFDDTPTLDSPSAAAAGSRKLSHRRQGSNSPTLSNTPSNVSGGKGSRGKASSRRNRMKTRKSIAGLSEEESSASEGEGTSEKMFEKAFSKFDPDDDGQMLVSDFLHFFDALQVQLPPLSEPLLENGVREQMLAMMQNYGEGIFITKEEAKGFYRAIAGRSLTEELDNRRQGRLAENEVSSFRGRLEAAGLEQEPPRRAQNLSPERRTPYGGSFARPYGPRATRQQSVTSVGAGTDEEVSEIMGVDTSADLTGNFLAASTPLNNKIRTTGQTYFSPIQSPTQSSLSFGDRREFAGSPGFNTSAHLEAELAAMHRELRQKQMEFDEKEQELSDLKHRQESDRESLEEEITSLNEETQRLRKELEGKRKEIVDINREKEELRAEAIVYLDQATDAKREIDLLHEQHDTNRETILTLSQESQRHAQQASDAIRRVEALTIDLQTVMGQMAEVEAHRASAQKKADLVTSMAKQVKDMKEEQKDREVEIEKLRSELHSRQLDIEMLMQGGSLTMGGSKGRARDSVGPGVMGVLSDELEDAGVGSEEEDDEDEDGPRRVVTITREYQTLPGTKKKKKRAIDFIPDTGEDSYDHIDRFDVADMGTQASASTMEMGTSMDGDLPIQSFNAEAQTDVTVGPGESLQDHYETSLPIPEFSMDEEGFNKIGEYVELAKVAALTREQLEDLASAINMQTEVIERMKDLGEANLKARMAKIQTVTKVINVSEDPLAYLNYATYWVQNYVRIYIKQAIQKAFRSTVKGDEMADFLNSYPQPSFKSVFLLSLFMLSLIMMTVVLGAYTYRWHSHEATWRKVNTLNRYSSRAQNSSPLVSRTMRVLWYNLEQALLGQQRRPI